MKVLEDISLKPFNGFGIDVRASQFASFHSTAELEELLAIGRSENKSPFILGGGSNILLTGNLNTLVLKNEIKGIDKIGEDNDFVYLKVGAGENWHGFVMECVRNNWGGVENLSLIPGNVGASPMQNIGAYGVEIKDVFEELEAFHREERQLVRFKLKDCHFGYRESVFKQRYKDQFVLLNVTYRLRKQPVFNTSYGAIEEELKKMGVVTLSIGAISQAVVNIRTSKLPDPTIIGNAGSFFKNPEVDQGKFLSLRKDFSAVVGYPLAEGKVKLAAGWMIEQCGWKGYRKGDAGCHERQALVLVNYGNATGSEIFALSEEIRQSVQKKFGVELEREVNII